jgi:hypothetical protein
VLDELDLNRLEDRRRDLGDVLLVLDRDQHLLDAASVRREDLLLEPADRQHVPASVTSPVIARSLRTGMRVSAETSAVAMVMPATGRPSGSRPRDVNVDVDLLVEVALEPELLGPRAHVAHRRLRRFLHHLAEAAGDEELALARA